MVLLEILVLLVGYICGSIPVGFLIGKIGYNIDVRKHGSGNIGMANVMRLCGKKAGIMTMIGDMVKGTIAVLSGRILIWTKKFEGLGKIGQVELTNEGLFLSLIVFTTIIGHSFPIWLKFKGGKSASVGGGAILGINPIAFVIIMSLWIVILKKTKYTSLSNLVAGMLYPPLLWVFAGTDPFFNNNWQAAIVGAICLLFVIWRHRENVSRLIKGTERKIGQKEKIEEKKG